MSLAVDTALEALRNMELSQENAEELARRIGNGELEERVTSTITVRVETAEGWAEGELLSALSARFLTIVKQEFMEGGDDLHGYDGPLVLRAEAEIEAGE